MCAILILSYFRWSRSLAGWTGAEGRAKLDCWVDSRVKRVLRCRSGHEQKQRHDLSQLRGVTLQAHVDRSLLRHYSITDVNTLLKRVEAGVGHIVIVECRLSPPGRNCLVAWTKFSAVRGTNL